LNGRSWSLPAWLSEYGDRASGSLPAESLVEAGREFTTLRVLSTECWSEMSQDPIFEGFLHLGFGLEASVILVMTF